MKKQITVLALTVLAACGAMNAQVVNRALSFTADGTVNCGQMPALDNLESYSIQFWMNPTQWTTDATILSRGDDFKATLDSEGSVMFTVGGTSLKATSSDLTPGDWNQLTLICDKGSATALVNGASVATGTLDAIAENDAPFTLGGNYTGLIDEVRLWNDALNEEMASFDYFVANTLNKWCPMWENLITYYKMDQGDCENLVEYKVLENPAPEYNNHGVLSDGVTRVEANNDKMPYLINSAYTNNERFFDRIIPRDQYLLSNDLIILGVDVWASDGHLETKSPNNHATDLTGVTYVESYQGREGVAQFDGAEGTRITCPAATLLPSSTYTFETWIYLDEWTPGAYLMRKESDDQTKGIAMYLGGTAAEPRLVARIDGNEIVSRPITTFTPGAWNHIGINPGTGGSKTYAMAFVVNGTQKNCESQQTTTTDATFSGNENEPLYIGEGLKGYLDETCIWKGKWGESDFKAHMTYIPLPALNRNVTVADMDKTSAYYRYDDPEDLGFSSHSQDSWLKIMKGAYDGHAGVKYYLSVQGKYTPDGVHGNWRDILGNATKRARFTADLVELSKNYDGVELDLEWIENGTQWTNYGVLSQEIREALPADKIFRVSLHNSYINFPTNKEDYVDGFTFQQYGPQENHFRYQNFVNNVMGNTSAGFTGFVNRFSRDKIMTSYSTTTSKATNGAEPTGIKNGLLDNYVPGDQNVDTWTNAQGATYTFMGPMQVYKRAKLTREQNLQGIFYWDMGNDNWEGTAAAPVMPKYNLAKYCSYGINANNDTIVTKVDVNHYETTAIDAITGGKKGNADITITPSPVTTTAMVTLGNGETPEQINVYNLSGAAVITNTDGTGTINATALQQGIYLLQVKDASGRNHSTKFIKR